MTVPWPRLNSTAFMSTAEGRDSPPAPTLTRCSIERIGIKLHAL